MKQYASCFSIEQGVNKFLKDKAAVSQYSFMPFTVQRSESPQLSGTILDYRLLYKTMYSSKRQTPSYMRPRLSLKNRCTVQTPEDKNPDTNYIKDGAMLQTFYTNKILNKDKLIATHLRRLGIRRSSLSPKKVVKSINPNKTSLLTPTLNIVQNRKRHSQDKNVVGLMRLLQGKQFRKRVVS